MITCSREGLAMRHLVKVVAVWVVLSLGAADAPAQQAEGWVGQKVITRFGTVLKVGRQVVDDPYRPANAQAGGRVVVPSYRVERVKGTWLWLVHEKPGISGWRWHAGERVGAVLWLVSEKPGISG